MFPSSEPGLVPPAGGARIERCFVVSRFEQRLFAQHARKKSTGVVNPR
jgi:Xaa-Pro aminopeptidase